MVLNRGVYLFEDANTSGMVVEMLQNEFLCDITIYFYSIKMNLYSVKYIFIISKYIFIQSKQICNILKYFMIKIFLYYMNFPFDTFDTK